MSLNFSFPPFAFFKTDSVQRAIVIIKSVLKYNCFSMSSRQTRYTKMWSISPAGRPALLDVFARLRLALILRCLVLRYPHTARLYWKKETKVWEMRDPALRETNFSERPTLEIWSRSTGGTSRLWATNANSNPSSRVVFAGRTRDEKENH